MEELNNKVMLTILGEDQIYEFDQLGINFDSPEREILNSLQEVIREANLSIEDAENPGEYVYGVKKSTNTGIIHVYPKDPAGGSVDAEKVKEVYLTVEIKENDWNNLLEYAKDFAVDETSQKIKYEIKEKTTK